MPQLEDDRLQSDRGLIFALLALLIGYGVATALGWTTAGGQHLEDVVHGVPHVWSIVPFTLMLGAIALLPLLGRTSHWWESNINKLYVAVNLALVTLLYIAFARPNASLGLAVDTLEHTLLYEYIPFIILLFSLYTISGGIRITGDLPAHPGTNTAFMALGGLLASLIGTTGAGMLLIRPLLQTNSERKHVAHTVIFFIFVVCNCGGLLLPLGDPPLFLGYLNGVDFLWTLGLWRSWLLVNVGLLLVYYLFDRLVHYPREMQADRTADELRRRPIAVAGLWPNAALLLGIVLCVALLDPGKPVPGTSWHPWFYLREAVELGLVLLSLVLGSRALRSENEFNYAAIIEVAVLFVGIFICMQPALEILNQRGAELGVDTPGEFYWWTGSLSAMLDNAPTYLVFFKAAQGLHAGGPSMAGVEVRMLAAISMGSVFMGAMTYIGNGPNFMVKAVAEQAGVKMPSFFGYMLYSFVFLLPLLILNYFLFVAH